MSVFQESLHTLRMARNKFKESKEALEQMKEDWEEHTVLVPLTGSMYVPGIIKKVDNIILDIGTGYYAEKVINFITF